MMHHEYLHESAIRAPPEKVVRELVLLLNASVRYGTSRTYCAGWRAHRLS